MELDIKQEVLIALYAQYQRDIPEMEKVTAAALNMDSVAFMFSLLKLQTEGLICGCVFIPPNEKNARRIRAVEKKNIFLTREGVEYVQNLLDLKALKTNKERLKSIVKSLGLAGAEVLKEYVMSLIPKIL